MSEQIEMAKAAIEKNCKLNDIDVNLGQLQLSVDPVNLIQVIDFVKNDPSCEFKQITDIAGVDFPENEKRFEVIYHFLSFRFNLRLRVKTQISEVDSLPCSGPKARRRYPWATVVKAGPTSATY